MEFWNYWPMGEKDTKDLIAPLSNIDPYLKEALQLCRQLQRKVEIKNYPACLLGQYSHFLINDQPELHIDPVFWKLFLGNGFYQCEFKNSCNAQECLGLNSAYIEKFGWEKDLLHPI